MVELRFADSIMKVPFFRGCVHETLVAICAQMQSFNADTGEAVVSEGDTDRDLFIIEHGAAEVIKEGYDYPLDYLPEGSFFGEMAFFGLTVKRGAAVITTEYTELSWISYAGLTQVLTVDTSLRKRMEDFATLRKEAHTGWHAQQMDADIIIEERGQSGEALVSARAGSPKATMKAMMDAVLIKNNFNDAKATAAPMTEGQRLNAKVDLLLTKVEALLSRQAE